MRLCGPQERLLQREITLQEAALHAAGFEVPSHKNKTEIDLFFLSGTTILLELIRKTPGKAKLQLSAAAWKREGKTPCRSSKRVDQTDTLWTNSHVAWREALETE